MFLISSSFFSGAGAGFAVWGLLFFWFFTVLFSSWIHSSSPAGQICPHRCSFCCGRCCGRYGFWTLWSAVCSRSEPSEWKRRLSGRLFCLRSADVSLRPDPGNRLFSRHSADVRRPGPGKIFSAVLALASSLAALALETAASSLAILALASSFGRLPTLASSLTVLALASSLVRPGPGNRRFFSRRSGPDFFSRHSGPGWLLSPF